MNFIQVLIIFVLSIQNSYLTKGIVTENDLWSYVKFEDSYYRFHREARLWEDARAICENEEAHLAIINSKEEESFINSIYDITSGAEVLNYTFVGYHDYFRKGVWVTIEGESIDRLEYQHWGPSQPLYTPDSEFERRCGALHSDGLHNFPCYYRLPYVCEIPASKVSTNNEATANGIQFRSSKTKRFIETAETYKRRRCHKHSWRHPTNKY